MTNAMLAGVDLILLALIWRFLYQPAILANYKLNLRIQRSHTRERFEALGALREPVCKEIDTLFSQSEAHLERLGLAKMLVIQFLVSRKKELKAEVEERMRLEYAAPTPELQQIVDEAHKIAQQQWAMYMMCSSVIGLVYLLVACFVGAILFPFFLLHAFIKRLSVGKWARNSRPQIVAAMALFACVTPARAHLMNWTPNSNAVEVFGFRNPLPNGELVHDPVSVPHN